MKILLNCLLFIEPFELFYRLVALYMFACTCTIAGLWWESSHTTSEERAAEANKDASQVNVAIPCLVFVGFVGRWWEGKLIVTPERAFVGIVSLLCIFFGFGVFLLLFLLLIVPVCFIYILLFKLCGYDVNGLWLYIIWVKLLR